MCILSLSLSTAGEVSSSSDASLYARPQIAATNELQMEVDSGERSHGTYQTGKPENHRLKIADWYSRGYVIVPRRVDSKALDDPMKL